MNSIIEMKDIVKSFYIGTPNELNILKILKKRLPK